MELTFLKAAVPLAKTYRSGKCTSSYPLVKELTSQIAYADDLNSFAQLLRSYGSQGYALMKGSLAKQITSESRAGLALKDKASEYLVLDIDYGDFSSAEAVIQRLPSEFHDCSYVLHYSSSFKITKKHFAGHLYFMLEDPLTADKLKEAVKAINLQFFRDDLTLNATKVALQWPLDPTINEASRLIYIAPPTCLGKQEDPVLDRTQVVLKSTDKLKLTVAMANTQIAITRKINDLREAEGLPRRQFAKANETVRVDPAQSWEMKQERNFVYFNINDGDSWGYYHPKDKPETILNFKGEPKYRTRDLLPEYWEQLGYAGGSREYFSFRAIEEDQYYNGWYDFEAQEHDIHPVSSTSRIKDFLRSHGEPVPDYVEDWNYVFDFRTNFTIVPKDKWINKYKPTRFMRERPAYSPRTVPATIKRVIWSVCGDDQEVYDRFLNWIAAIIQKREMSRTAWVFNGIPGTGKGVMFNRILAPIIGESYCQSKTIEGMEDSFNGYLENCVLLMVDEFNVSDSHKAKTIVAKLKNLIVEPRISIRKMRQQARMIQNFSNLLIFSNEIAPMWIAEHDRRFNVGVYQTKRLILKNDDFDLIEAELDDFAAFLGTLEVNDEWLEMPLRNASRTELQDLTVTTIDECVRRMRDGDFDYFLEMVPVDEAKHLAPEVLAYTNALKDIYLQTKAGESAKIPRDKLRDLFNYAAGNMPPTPAKFTKLLRHRGMHVKPLSYDGRTVRGFEVMMKVGNEVEAEEVLLSKSKSLRSVK
jgi:hypothetical protein